MKLQRHYKIGNTVLQIKKENSPPYLRWPSLNGVKLTSFTPHPYDGFVQALRPKESLVFAFRVKNSLIDQGWHIRYEVITSKIQFDSLMDIYYENGVSKIKERVNVNHEDFIGIFAKQQIASIDRYNEETHFKNELLYENGSSVSRPVEDIVFAAILSGRTTDDLAWADREF